MARRNDPKDAPADFDELLAEEPAAVVEVQGTINDIPVGEPEIVAAAELTPAQKLLAEARAKAAELDALPAEEDPYRGLSVEEIKELELLNARIARADAEKNTITTAEPRELTPAEKEAEDRQARINNELLIQAERKTDRFDNSRKGGTGEIILFHVVRDGVTAFGDVWYRGQEIEIEVGTAAYKRTLDKNGDSWLDIVGDEEAQYIRWGERRFARGEFRPRPGERFEDALVSMDQRRKRTVPVVAV